MSAYIQSRLIREFLAVAIFIPLLLTIPVILNPMTANFIERKTLLTPKNILYLSVFAFVLQVLVFGIPILFSSFGNNIKSYLLITALSIIVSTVSFFLSALVTYWFYDGTQSTSSFTSKAYFSMLCYVLIILCILLGEPIYNILFSNGPSYLYLVFKGIILILHPTLVSSVFGCNALKKCAIHREEIFLLGFFWGICSFGMFVIPNIFSVFKLPILILIIWAIISAVVAYISALLRNRSNT